MRALAIFICSGVVAQSNDDGFSLLQHASVRSQTQHGHGSYAAEFMSSFDKKDDDDPLDRERKMCPHEIEEQKKTSGRDFGCYREDWSQKLSTEGRPKKCSWWGEPHVSATFMNQTVKIQGIAYDTFYTPGLFRMARAKDNSWEVQTFNCGVYASAFAARVGSDLIEFIGSDNGVDIYLNGTLYTGSLPLEQENGLYMADHYAGRVRNNAGGGGASMSKGRTACVQNDKTGQLSFEMLAGKANSGGGNLNIHIEAVDGSWDSEDSNSMCTKEVGNPDQKGRSYQGRRDFNWGLESLSPQESLFTVGTKACELCSTKNWWPNCCCTKTADGECYSHENSCATKAPALNKDAGMVFANQACTQKGRSLEDAQAACNHLKVNDEFYKDCQYDWCMNGDNDDVAAQAEDELNWEYPESKCVREGCDPAKVCCDSLKNKQTLSLGNVAQNNLCGDGDGAKELRYSAVSTASDGSQMDLVIKPTGEFRCTNGVTNARQGVTGDFGKIVIPVGQEVEFSFNFVKAGTDDPADVSDSVPFSFLDLDQGKNGKQRESVKVCGALNAVVTSNSELEQSTDGDCIKMTSTTKGNRADNPNSAGDLNTEQRARTVAYQTQGSSFTATLGVSAKGKQSRGFMFSGHPTVACAEAADML